MSLPPRDPSTAPDTTFTDDDLIPREIYPFSEEEFQDDILKKEEEDRVKEKEENKDKKEELPLLLEQNLTRDNLSNVEAFVAEFLQGLRDKTRYLLIIRGKMDEENISYVILGEVPLYVLNDPVVMNTKYTAIFKLVNSRVRAWIASLMHNGMGDEMISFRLIVHKISFVNL